MLKSFILIYNDVPTPHQKRPGPVSPDLYLCNRDKRRPGPEMPHVYLRGAQLPNGRARRATARGSWRRKRDLIHVRWGGAQAWELLDRSKAEMKATLGNRTTRRLLSSSVRLLVLRVHQVNGNRGVSAAAPFRAPPYRFRVSSGASLRKLRSATPTPDTRA